MERSDYIQFCRRFLPQLQSLYERCWEDGPELRNGLFELALDAEHLILRIRKMDGLPGPHDLSQLEAAANEMLTRPAVVSPNDDFCCNETPSANATIGNNRSLSPFTSGLQKPAVSSDDILQFADLGFYFGEEDWLEPEQPSGFSRVSPCFSFVNDIDSSGNWASPVPTANAGRRKRMEVSRDLKTVVRTDTPCLDSLGHSPVPKTHENPQLLQKPTVSSKRRRDAEDKYSTPPPKRALSYTPPICSEKPLVSLLCDNKEIAHEGISVDEEIYQDGYSIAAAILSDETRHVRLERNLPMGNAANCAVGVRRPTLTGEHKVDYDCSACGNSYSARIRGNPLWAMYKQMCPHCKVDQIPRISIRSSVNLQAMQHHMAAVYECTRDDVRGALPAASDGEQLKRGTNKESVGEQKKETESDMPALYPWYCALSTLDSVKLSQLLTSSMLLENSVCMEDPLRSAVQRLRTHAECCQVTVKREIGRHEFNPDSTHWSRQCGYPWCTQVKSL